MTQTNPEVSVVPTRIALEDVVPTIAEAFGADHCLIWSGEWQKWWRPEGNGYTSQADKAGVFTIAEAFARTRHCDPTKQIAFERVPSARLAHQTPPATQPSATVGEVERLRDALEQADFDLCVAIDQLSEARPSVASHLFEAKEKIAATLHTPPPVATATVVDARLLAAIKAARGWYGPADDEGTKAALSELDDAVAAWSATPTPPAGDR